MPCSPVEATRCLRHLFDKCRDPRHAARAFRRLGVGFWRVLRDVYPWPSSTPKTKADFGGHLAGGLPQTRGWLCRSEINTKPACRRGWARLSHRMLEHRSYFGSFASALVAAAFATFRLSSSTPTVTLRPASTAFPARPSTSSFVRSVQASTGATGAAALTSCLHSGVTRSRTVQRYSTARSAIVSPRSIIEKPSRNSASVIDSGGFVKK